MKLYCVVFSFTFFYYYFTVSTSRATNSSHLSCSTYLSAIKCIRCISHSIGITRCMKGLFPISNCVMNPFHDSLATHEKKYLYYDNRNSSLSISTQFSRFCFFFSYSVSFARMMKWTGHKYDYWMLTNWIVNRNIAMHTDFYRFKCFNYGFLIILLLLQFSVIVTWHEHDSKFIYRFMSYFSTECCGWILKSQDYCGCYFECIVW